MPRQPVHGQQQAASDEPRRDDRARKTNMKPEARAKLARQVFALSKAFEANLPQKPSKEQTEQALKFINSDEEYGQWINEVKEGLMAKYHEPSADMIMGILRSKLAPELASLFYGSRMCGVIQAFLKIIDLQRTTPKSWMPEDKKNWLESLDYDIVVRLDRLNEEDEEDEEDEDYVSMIAKEVERKDRTAWGPVRIAFNATYEMGASWDAYLRRLQRRSTTTSRPTTRPTTKSKGKVPGEEGSKRPTPKPAAKPKGKVPGEGEADTKGSANPRTSARKAAASKGKAPKLTKAAQQLVSQLRAVNSGSEDLASAIADALESGSYDVTTAKKRAVEAGISLDD